MKRGIFLLIMTTISVVHTVNAQDVALKTNILSDAFMNINAGIEVGLAPRWTLVEDSTHGLYRIVVGGNIGRCNLKLVIGSVTGLQAILSESMFMAGSII